MIRTSAAALVGLLFLASPLMAEEFKGAKVKSVYEKLMKLTLTVKEGGKDKDVTVHVGFGTEGTDADGKSVKGPELLKALKEGTVVDVTTKTVDGAVVGVEGKAEVAKTIKVAKEK
jgi:hypothetical protein